MDNDTEQNILKKQVRFMSNSNASIYIMRHGRTEWNASGKLQGRQNSPLLPESIEELYRMGSILCGCGISALYSSPLERCRQTADIISKMIGIPALFIDDLSECDHGHCEGLSMDEAREKFPEFFYERETGDKWSVRWPGGESYADLSVRVRQAVEKMDFTRPTLIIAHETVNKVLAGLLLGFDHYEIMQKKQKNSEIYRINRAEMLLEILQNQDESNII